MRERVAMDNRCFSTTAGHVQVYIFLEKIILLVEQVKKELKESDRDMKGWLGWSLLIERDGCRRVKKTVQ